MLVPSPGVDVKEGIWVSWVLGNSASCYSDIFHGKCSFPEANQFLKQIYPCWWCSSTDKHSVDVQVEKRAVLGGVKKAPGGGSSLTMQNLHALTPQKSWDAYADKILSIFSQSEDCQHSSTQAIMYESHNIHASLRPALSIPLFLHICRM